MFFKAYIASIVALALFAGALYWQNGNLSDRLEAAEIRAENAIADLSLAHAALKAQAAHTARIEALARELAAIERDIPNMEGSNDPIDPATIAFLRRLGVLAK